MGIITKLANRIEEVREEIAVSKIDLVTAEREKLKDDLYMALSVIAGLLEKRHLQGGILDSKEDRAAARAIRFCAEHGAAEIIYEQGDRVRARIGV